jgi:hypothetical protein
MAAKNLLLNPAEKWGIAIPESALWGQSDHAELWVVARSLPASGGPTTPKAVHRWRLQSFEHWRS